MLRNVSRGIRNRGFAAAGGGMAITGEQMQDTGCVSGCSAAGTQNE